MKNKDYGASMGAKSQSYQPSDSQFAGKQSGKTTKYMERTNKILTKEASKLRSMAYKGRYE